VRTATRRHKCETDDAEYAGCIHCRLVAWSCAGRGCSVRVGSGAVSKKRRRAQEMDGDADPEKAPTVKKRKRLVKLNRRTTRRMLRRKLDEWWEEGVQPHMLCDLLLTLIDNMRIKR